MNRKEGWKIGRVEGWMEEWKEEGWKKEGWKSGSGRMDER